MPYINGRRLTLDKKQQASVLNPADGSTVATISMAAAAQMTQAIDAAFAARESWANTPPAEREIILIRAAEIIEAKRSEFVDVLIDEAGSTFGKAQFEVSFTVTQVRASAGEARRLFGQTMPSDLPGLVSMAIRRPLGVVAGIA